MKMRRMALLLAALMLALTGCSFPEQYPIENVQNILVAGVDYEDGQVRLTVVVDKIKQGSKPGEEQIGTQVYTATGATVFEAKRQMRTFTEKRTSWYHLKYIVLGEEAAKQDISGVLDYFCENDETRFLHRLVVSRGMSAAEFFAAAVTHESGFSHYLDSLFREARQVGKTSEVRLLDYASACECPWSSLYIPTVQLIPSMQHGSIPEGNAESSDSNYLVLLSGYAIFKENKLAGYLDARQAMGLNIMINEFEGAEITVDDMRGQPVSLEVVSSKAQIKTDLSDGRPSASINVVIDTFMVEYRETSDATQDEYLAFLEAQQNLSAMDMVMAALTEARHYGTDVFSIGNALYHAYPTESKKLEQCWPEIFSSMDISVKVTSSIQCTYSMLNAPGQ